MPKMKTKRAAAKRFSKTASGKFKRKRNYFMHNKKEKLTSQSAQSIGLLLIFVCALPSYLDVSF